jgi:hypothetical protein
MRRDILHFCTAKIALADDITQTVIRGYFNPISWPEVDVIRSIHGDSAVTEVEPFVEVKQTARDEKIRLAGIYGNDVIEAVYPGRNPQMEMIAPGVKLKVAPVWHSPIDKDPALFDQDPATRSVAKGAATFPA